MSIVEIAPTPPSTGGQDQDASPATGRQGTNTIILRPTSGWSSLQVHEVWQFRDLLFTLAARDLRLRYKQTALGVLWVVLQPILAAGIFTVVFGMIAKIPTGSDHVPYFVFAFAGQLGWNLFSGTVSRCSACLVGNAHLISKVYFPRLILPLSIVPSNFVDFAVAGVVMGLILAWQWIVPGWQIVLLPVWILILLAMAMGIGLITAALAVSYRDIGYILPVFLQMAMYASPVPYGASAVAALPDKVKPFYYLNPVSGPLEGFRWSLLNIGAPSWSMIAYSASVAAILFAGGAFSFKRMERRFADVV